MREVREITLTGHRGGVALVDVVDYDYLMRWKWHMNALGYAVRNTRVKSGGRTITRCIRMHREVLKPPEGYEADHLNGVRLDNRRANLRAALHGTNVRNRPGKVGARSRYKGVFRNVASSGRVFWQAKMKLDGVAHYLGTFRDEESAALAYAEGVRRLTGEIVLPFATLTR